MYRREKYLILMEKESIIVNANDAVLLHPQRRIMMILTAINIKVKLLVAIDSEQD